MDTAWHLAKIDHLILELLEDEFPRLADGKYGSRSANLRAVMNENGYQQDFAVAQELRREIREIQNKTMTLGQGYLANEGVVLLWDRVFSIMMNKDRFPVWSTPREVAMKVLPLTGKLHGLMVTSHAARLLRPEFVQVLRARYKMLQELWNTVGDSHLPKTLRFVPW